MDKNLMQALFILGFFIGGFLAGFAIGPQAMVDKAYNNCAMECNIIIKNISGQLPNLYYEDYAMGVLNDTEHYTRENPQQGPG
jgi:hypothetical protein